MAHCMRVLHRQGGKASSLLLTKVQVKCFHISPLAMSRFNKEGLPYDKVAKILEVVKKRFNRPLTLVEKVLHSHLDEPQKQIEPNPKKSKMETALPATHKKRPKEKSKISCSESFESILEAKAFVDKTLLIKEVFQRQSEENDGTGIVENEQPKLMITAPRRFGKSVNLDMFRRFLELEVDEETGKRITAVDLESETVCDTPNYKLFTVNENSEEMHLQIMADDEFVKTHFGKYPIIDVHFLCYGIVRNETDALTICKDGIHEAFKKHPYLYESSESQLEVDERKKCEQWCTYKGKHGSPNYEQFERDNVIDGLRDLSKYLRKFHGRKVFVLIDEFDSIVSTTVGTVVDKDEFEKIIKVVMAVIGSVVKDNDDNLAGVLITGILNLHGTGISTLLGNVKPETFGEDTPRLKYYGFNLEEVEKLFEIFSVDKALRKKAINKYNCYYTERGEHGIFNPFAIVRFLVDCNMGDVSLRDYWRESGDVHSLDYLFKQDKVKEMIRHMLQGRWFPAKFSGQLNLENLTELHIANTDSQARISTNVVSLFLLHQGYMSYIRRRESLPTAVGIPDNLRPVFIRKMVNHLAQHCGIGNYARRGCQILLNNVMHVVNKDKAEFIKALKLFTDKLGELIETASIDPCDEAAVETVVLSVVLAAGYTCTDQVYNFEQNRLIAHKDGQGIIIELKYKEDSSRGALAQLFTQGNFKNFINEKHYDGSDIKLHLAMGLHFTEKKKGSKVMATVHCLRHVDINEVLEKMNIEKVDEKGTEIVTEDRIAMACAEKEGTNSFVEKAICVT